MGVAGVAVSHGGELADDGLGQDGRVTVGTPADAAPAEVASVLLRVVIRVATAGEGPPHAADGLADGDVARANVALQDRVPPAAVGTVAADSAVVAGSNGVQRGDIRADDEDLAHVAGLAVLGFEGENGHIGLAVDGRDATVDDKTSGGLRIGVKKGHQWCAQWRVSPRPPAQGGQVTIRHH